MKIRALAILLCLCFVAGLAGCGKKGAENSSDVDASNSSVDSYVSNDDYGSSDNGYVDSGSNNQNNSTVNSNVQSNTGSNVQSNNSSNVQNNSTINSNVSSNNTSSNVQNNNSSNNQNNSTVNSNVQSNNSSNVSSNNTSSNNNQNQTSSMFDYTNPKIYTMDTLVSMGIEPARTSDPAIEAAANKLLAKIEANPDTIKPKSGGKTIYVANDGKDVKGNGYSKEKPVKTIEYANLLAKSGDVVLLKRGNFWREKVICVAEVSYGAYGTGNKPTIYGAPNNAAESMWSLDAPNIYRVRAGSPLDIGLIVFDHGKACGSKKFNKADLKEDYDFFCQGGAVYVYCSKGNPAEMYSDIEICVTDHIVKLKANSTIQNWRIMYGGAHGISITGSPPNVTVDGCIVGYIGGGIQGGLSNNTTRYGNGIEVWGGCNGYTIKNCHVYQCYDAGITMQYAGNLDEKDILFESNLLEYSVYNIEYFLNNGTGKMIDVLIKDNIVRHGGYGWGYYSRGDKNNGTNVMGRGKNMTENFVFKNNIFDHAKSFLIEIQSVEDKYLPSFSGNTYALYENSRVCRKQDHNYGVNRYGMDAVTEGLGDKTGKLIKYKKPN